MGDPAHNTRDRVLVPVERKESAGCDLVRCQVCVRPVGGELSARVHVGVGRQDSLWWTYHQSIRISSIYSVHSINHSNVWHAYLQSFIFIICISSIISMHGMNIINHFNSIHGMNIMNHFNS